MCSPSLLRVVGAPSVESQHQQQQAQLGKPKLNPRAIEFVASHSTSEASTPERRGSCDGGSVAGATHECAMSGSGAHEAQEPATGVPARENGAGGQEGALDTLPSFASHPSLGMAASPRVSASRPPIAAPHPPPRCLALLGDGPRAGGPPGAPRRAPALLVAYCVASGGGGRAGQGVAVARARNVAVVVPPPHTLTHAHPPRLRRACCLRGCPQWRWGSGAALRAATSSRRPRPGWPALAAPAAATSRRGGLPPTP